MGHHRTKLVLASLQKGSGRTHRLKRALLERGRVVLWVVTFLTVVFVIVTTIVDYQGATALGMLVLTVILLLFTAAILHLTIPEPARLWVMRQEELGYDFTSLAIHAKVYRETTSYNCTSP